MKRFIPSSIAGVLMIIAGHAAAVENLVESVAQGCDKELTSYCSNVTPGEGRILACLYAHQDKLSGRCEYALYDAAVQLERAVSALSYLASECDADLEKFCASVDPGEGRILHCLNENRGKVRKRCRSAMQDIDLKAD
jgi:hypothetical protein